MKTIVVPVELLPCPFCGETPDIETWHGGKPTKHMVSCINNECTCGPQCTGETHALAVKNWNTRAATPPQSEPLRCNLTGMKGCAYPVNAAPDDRSGFLPLNVAAKGSAEGAQTVNGSARDADTGSSNTIQDPSFAAPDYHICYSVAEDRSHCVTCGRELLDLAVSAAPRFEDELLKPQTVISLTGTPNFSGMFTTGAAVSTTLPGALTGGLTVSSGFITGNIVAKPLTGNAGGTNIIAPMPDVPAASVSSAEAYAMDCEGYAAPTTMNLGESALPLSRIDLEAYASSSHRLPFEISMAHQAMRAIELEQRVAGLKSEWFRKGQESVRRKNESGCCCKIGDDDKILSACNAHAEWAKQQRVKQVEGRPVPLSDWQKLEKENAEAWEVVADLCTQHHEMLVEINTLQAELAELKARVKP